MIYSTVEELKADFEGRRAHLNFFDANAWVGFQVEPAYNRICKTDELLKELSLSNINEAIVTHTGALYYNLVEGNELTLEAISGQEQLYGAVVLSPNTTGELGQTKEYIDRAIKRKARIARLFPKLHTFCLQPWCAGSVLEALQERRIPLMLWHSETDWNEVHSLCQSYPNLPIIIEGTGRKILYDNRMFYRLLSLHKNLHLEIHCLTNCRILEEMVGMLGAEQFIFGSYLPYKEPAVTMMLLAYSGISDDAKRLIAGGNIRRLLEEVRI
ncbi:MAG TPA: hypothetical protein DCL60_06340 [Armatimonadetes bacterium]|jgi:predicted TIM-barrel fold metal-dependent hydrolase|nr:hypothetical protein [Armatimonadota bacterium]